MFDVEGTRKWSEVRKEVDSDTDRWLIRCSLLVRSKSSMLPFTYVGQVMS